MTSTSSRLRHSHALFTATRWSPFFSVAFTSCIRCHKFHSRSSLIYTSFRCPFVSFVVHMWPSVPTKPGQSRTDPFRVNSMQSHFRVESSIFGFWDERMLYLFFYHFNLKINKICWCKLLFCPIFGAMMVNKGSVDWNKRSQITANFPKISHLPTLRAIPPHGQWYHRKARGLQILFSLITFGNYVIIDQ